MKITTDEVRETVEILDDIVERYKKTRQEAKRDWRTYEQRLEKRIKTAVRELEPLVGEAVEGIVVEKVERRGRPPELALKQKVILLLIKHLLIKSNRDMSFMLVMFSMLSGVDVSYKSIERLYSDVEVSMALHNLHSLILKRKGVETADCTGDATGYSLSVGKHYATEAHKKKDEAKENKEGEMKFVYSFKMMDLGTRMYIGYGTSFKSEKDAFNKAIDMIGTSGINMESVRLDKYYSNQCDVEMFEQNFRTTSIYLIPKKNATIDGPWKWKRMLHAFVNNTLDYLGEYYKREQSESGFSEDKKRMGWKIAQRREDRINTADFCTMIWHNLFWLG